MNNQVKNPQSNWAQDALTYMSAIERTPQSSPGPVFESSGLKFTTLEDVLRERKPSGGVSFQNVDPAFVASVQSWNTNGKAKKNSRITTPVKIGASLAALALLGGYGVANAKGLMPNFEPGVPLATVIDDANCTKVRATIAHQSLTTIVMKYVKQPDGKIVAVPEEVVGAANVPKFQDVGQLSLLFCQLKGDDAPAVKKGNEVVVNRGSFALVPKFNVGKDGVACKPDAKVGEDSMCFTPLGQPMVKNDAIGMTEEQAKQLNTFFRVADDGKTLNQTVVAATLAKSRYATLSSQQMAQCTTDVRAIMDKNITVLLSDRLATTNLKVTFLGEYVDPNEAFSNMNQNGELIKADAFDVKQDGNVTCEPAKAVA